MHILQLNSYFSDNHLYKEIFRRIDKEHSQTVFVPQGKNSKVEGIELQNGEIHFANICTPLDRFLYFRKIHKAFSALLDLNVKADFIHAHNLFTDGVLAYKYKKKYGTNYIVAIRLTDIFLQYKYFIYRRPLANKVLKNASKIVFISPIQVEQVLSFFKDERLKQEIKDKAVVIPNGINSYWLDNKVTEQHTQSEVLNLLFVGRIVKVKNVFRQLEAVNKLSQKGVPVKLRIIGGKYHHEPDYYNEFLEAIKDNVNVEYLGEIWDKDIIRKEYQRADMFLMPSISELFGLTYIEAISQNVPVIYSKNTGIMPYLEGKAYAEMVDQLSVDSIAEGIEKLSARLSNLGVFSDFADDYNWDNIVSKYKDIYDSVR